ncbi:MAG: hypothetical protein AAF845_07780 [Bacteroidota bacterium]
MTPELPAFPCPHCGDRAFTKRTVANDAPASAGTVLTHLHVCTSCGENYLSTVCVAADRTRTETWDYYLERETSLRRVRRYTPAGTYDLVEAKPLFIVDGRDVAEAEWRAALASARAMPSPLLDAETSRTASTIQRWMAWWKAVSYRPAMGSAGFRLIGLGTPDPAPHSRAA